MTNDFPNEPVSCCETCDFVLRIGIFFDGTLNNATNISHQRGKGFREEADDSYKSDYTNVWKLHKVYPRLHSQRTIKGERYIFGNFYIEGVGTDDLEDDDGWDSATGSWTTGIIAKTKKGGAAAWGFVDAYANCNIRRIELDIFGFSRGAATARHFANLIKKLDGIHTVSTFQAKDYGRRPRGWERKLEPTDAMRGPKRTLNQQRRYLYSVFSEIPTQIKFIGLFDTVPSVISSAIDHTAQNDDNGVVMTDLPPGIATEKVIHLTALNEQRGNFGLKSVLSNPVACDLPEVNEEGNHLEECMYGAHSDIGGGYVSKETKMELGTAESAAEKALEKGWIGEHVSKSCTSETSISPNFLMPTQNTTETCIIEGENGRIIRTREIIDNGYTTPIEEYETKMERDHVDGRYARIPLQKMHDYAVANTVPFKSLDPDKNPNDSQFLRDQVDLPEDLQSIRDKLMVHKEISSEELELLYKDYLHHSDNEKSIRFLPFITPHARHESGKRLIFPNKS
ncbi:T6SS phospholipase effector Tle1-like catalytic domain-containing protein [Pseudovibrio sp. WM33]|uniref:T6SS phospholipase effector Tle1-like catalytic domain-containing protein n=1 Tax=Pseudovibrio sp. WM33 TaxID=1735585 RepID=UPI0007AE3B09|nr:DUF2235 domain-containing protein [Pseudovibrio sp. WM33]KZL26278.1 hypothetical protein PsWM33_01490 [Pseudovibrio sp. WM33]